MDNAVIYARFSSAKQQEQSIDGQLRFCNEYAARYGYKVVGEYCDRAISGTTDQRPEFQRMIKDSAAGKFRYVIVWKLDRFSRDRYAAALYKHNLKKNGVKVLSATENIGEGDESIILEAVLEAMAEIYVKQLSQNTRRGMREAVLQGRNAGGAVPYGYDSVDKHLVVNEKQAAIARRAFQLYAEGAQIKDICEEFNVKGYLTRTGKPFNRESFHRMFVNEKYIGRFHYGDIVIDDGCPAIIDKDIFDKCCRRQKANQRAKSGKPAKIEYLLKGKAFCGHCGATLVGDSGTSKSGVRHEYYSCSARKKKTKACDKQREKKGYLEWYVVEQTVKYVLQPDRLDFIAENVVKMFSDGSAAAELKALKSKRSEFEKELDRLTDSLINATSQRVIDKINRRADELDILLTDIETEIAELSASKDLTLTVGEVKAWLTKFCDGDALDVNFQKRIIDILVNSVFVYDDKIVIYFNVRDGKQVTYTQMIEESADTFEELSCSDIVSNGSPKSCCSQRGFFFLFK